MPFALILIFLPLPLPQTSRNNMAVEIERKFLVKGDYKPMLLKAPGSFKAICHYRPNAQFVFGSEAIKGF
jgi:hypothetical protein